MAHAFDIRRTMFAALVVLAALPGGVVTAEPTADVADAHVRLDSQQTAWQGQTLSFDGATAVEAAADAGLRQVAESDRSFTLYTVREDDTLGQVVDTVTLDPSGAAVIDTTPLDGRYVLVYEEHVVHVDDGRGSLGESASTANLSAAGWTVTTDDDDVTAQFDDQTADGTVALDQHTDAQFAGQVDLPTGTEITLRLHNDGPRPVLFSVQTTLGAGGRFEERLDLSAVRSGTVLNVSVSLDETTLATATAVVGGDDSASETSQVASATRQTDETTRSRTQTTIPGFGITVGSIALVASMLALSVRERR
ncbi:hypothetical protein [Halogranum rubrum]|nr:hypothetical protein [Halogranum salarium]